MISPCGDESYFLLASTRRQERQNIRGIQNSSIVENLMVTAVRFYAQLIIETGSLNACVREKESMRTVSTSFFSSLFFFLNFIYAHGPLLNFSPPTALALLCLS